MGQPFYYGTGELAICWSDASGFTQLAVLSGCNTATPATSAVYVSALGDNDQVGPSREANICVPLQYSTYMWPFDESVFDFYLDADMGTGSDWAYGTEHGDMLLSNEYGSFGNLLPADSAEDHLCGYGGNDILYGDGDDSEAYEELLSGGAGTDYCLGGYDGDYYDWANCETIYHASSSAGFLGCPMWGPPRLWWW